MDKDEIKTLKERFEKENVWGMLTSIDLHSCEPATIRDADKLKEYVNLLCKRIEMKKFGDTVVVNFGEDERVAGFSMTQLIETSLISGHFANQSNNVFIDIFSCKFYDPKEAAEFTKEFFKAKDYKIHTVLRK